jgi:hypothetical protein
MTAHYVGGPLAMFWKPLPSLIFGAFATFAGLSYALMPETLGHVLPDTIEQAENFRRRPRKTNERIYPNVDDSEMAECKPTTTNSEKIFPNGASEHHQNGKMSPLPDAVSHSEMNDKATVVSSL